WPARGPPTASRPPASSWRGWRGTPAATAGGRSWRGTAKWRSSSGRSIVGSWEGTRDPGGHAGALLPGRRPLLPLPGLPRDRPPLDLPRAADERDPRDHDDALEDPPGGSSGLHGHRVG